MNFYYDPILGLQYTYLGDLFLIDIEAIPVSDSRVEEWIKKFSQVGI